MISNSHILHAYKLVSDQSGTVIEAAELSDAIRSEDLTWVHLNASAEQSRTWIEQELTYLDPFIITALLEEETRPRMTESKDGVLLILRGVNTHEHANPEDMVSIRVWVDSQRIISLERRSVRAIDDIAQKINSGRAPANTGDFICMLIHRLFYRMEIALSELDDMTDMIEETILEQADTMQRDAIVSVRKQAIMFRRYMAPQRDAIGQLRMAGITWLDENHKRQLQEAHNTITRYVEDLDAMRERAQIVKDELANILADKLNRNMYVLSVIAAIFLPLGFLTGLLGINIGGIPGTENPDAFWTFSLALTLLVIIQIIAFKKMKWF